METRILYREVTTTYDTHHSATINATQMYCSLRRVDCIFMLCKNIYFIFIHIILCRYFSNTNIIHLYSNEFMESGRYLTTSLYHYYWLVVVAVMAPEPHPQESVQAVLNCTLILTLEIHAHWIAPPLYTDHATKSKIQPLKIQIK